MAQNGFRPPQAWFVTLTYADPDAWEPRHVADALRRFRRYCEKRQVPCRYTWVAEIQPKRFMSTGKAVVHYHLLAWLPVGVSMPHWDRATTTRAAWWPHGMSNTEKALSGVGYLMKYLSKLGDQNTFPKGLRLYGIGGLNPQARSIRAWFNLPEWVKAVYGVGDVFRRGSSIVVRETGEILEKAYRVVRVPGGIILHALRDLPERFHSGCYSTYVAQ